MKTLKLSTGSFDQDNTFTVDVSQGSLRHGRRAMPITCTLQQHYETSGDGIYWFMQRAGCLKAQYTDKDRAERERLNAMEPVRQGEVVLIDGQAYKVDVKGDFSDAAVLKPVY